MGVDRRERAPDFRFSLVGGREKRVTEQLAEAVFTVVGYRGIKTILAVQDRVIIGWGEQTNINRLMNANGRARFYFPAKFALL
jgi:hypothetical protein